MVIYESLRLYPPVPVVSREAFQDIKFGDINVPKGVIVWTLMVALQQDPDIWGPDANIFRPESRGVLGSVLVGFNGYGQPKPNILVCEILNRNQSKWLEINRFRCISISVGFGRFSVFQREN